MPEQPMHPRDAPWDSTYSNYYQLGDILRSVAEAHSSITVDSNTLQRWRDLMAIMREVDTCIDDTAASPADVLAEIQSFDRFRTRYPSIAPEATGPEMHNRIMSRAERLFRLGSWVSAAETPFRYIHLRAAEAVQTAELFADSASSEVRAHPNFRKKFMPLLHSFGIAACMLDSAHDLTQDYAEDKAAIQPVLGLRLHLFGISIKYAAPHLGLYLYPSVAKQLGIAARTHVWQKRRQSKK